MADKTTRTEKIFAWLGTMLSTVAGGAIVILGNHYLWKTQFSDQQHAQYCNEIRDLYKDTAAINLKLAHLTNKQTSLSINLHYAAAKNYNSTNAVTQAELLELQNNFNRSEEHTSELQSQSNLVC